MANWGDISRAFNCAESNDTPIKPDTQIDEWDTMAEAARFALDQLIFKGDKLADRIEELEAKLAQQDDLVQAAVAEALREAADAVEDYCSDAPDLAGHGHSGAIRDIITAIRKGGE